jgi:proteic killer suppression protein
MLKTFADPATADLFAGKRVARWTNIQTVATRKLQQLDSAMTLDSLRVPPGNRLEALSGDCKGQHSMRINEQWRLCFVWRDEGVQAVEIVDYH